MFSFFKKKKVKKEVPGWASFFNQDEYSAFKKELDSYFKSLNIKYEVGDGIVHVDKETEFGVSVLGLSNVAQVCKHNHLQDYGGIIAEHFNTLIRSRQFDLTFEQIIGNFEEVKKYIGIRLHDYSYIATVGKENVIGKHIAGDVHTMLVFDLPESIKNIKPEQAEVWGKSEDELIRLGIENMKAQYPFEISKENLKDFDIWFVQGNHFFTPNIIFDIENRPELIGTYGSLIGLPHRHAVLIYPIESLEIIQAINQLIPVIYGMNQDGPGSVSNNLLWYYQGEYTNLPYQLEEKALQFIPPDNFLDILNHLKK